MADANRTLNCTARQRAILTAIVESYIRTGEPVGSATLARLQVVDGIGNVIAMSPATIRNEMAELVHAGLLEQPHTSAGRIPTAQAFRLYVEELSGGATPRIAPARLSRPPRARRSIPASLDSPGLRPSCSAPPTSWQPFPAASASPSPPPRRAICWSTSTSPDSRRPVSSPSSSRAPAWSAIASSPSTATSPCSNSRPAARFLNENFRGWSVERVRAEIARMMERERSEYQILLKQVQNLWTRTVPQSDPSAQTVYVEGVANLVSYEVGSQQDASRLREVLAALEEKQRLVDLLNSYIDARQESVRVVFDLEEHAPEMAGLVLIAAPARMGGETRGTVGVIGPKRMHYENTMNAVSYISRVFDRMLHPNG